MEVLFKKYPDWSMLKNNWERQQMLDSWGSSCHFLFSQAAVCMIRRGTPPTTARKHYELFLRLSFPTALPRPPPCPPGLCPAALCGWVLISQHHHSGWTPDPPTWCCCCFSPASCTPVRTHFCAAKDKGCSPQLNLIWWFSLLSFLSFSPHTGQCARGQSCK